MRADSSSLCFRTFEDFARFRLITGQRGVQAQPNSSAHIREEEEKKASALQSLMNVCVPKPQAANIL